MAWSEEEIERAGLDQFPEFVKLVWAHLNLPDPTKVQLEIAHTLQFGNRRLVVMAFRGVGKTWLTAAFAVWNLFLDPQKKILIVSASQTYADKIATFMKQLIDSMEILAFLRPRAEQRRSAIAFDVGPATPDPSPSVTSAGIGGQITGNRADIIIADDVEVPKNSFTHLLRDKLSEQVKEFDAVLKPLPDSRVLFLGTPQTEQSIYPKLRDRGYKLVTWPAQVPDSVTPYKGNLAPSVLRLIETGAVAGTPTDPQRFDTQELSERMASYGHTSYARQYLLDPTPSDEDRFPLKTGDCIVFDCDSHSTPIRVVWSRDSGYILADLHSGGLDRDVWRKPFFTSEERSDYQGTVMAIDPSGKGRDETAYAIVRYAQGLLYLVSAGGFVNGMDPKTQEALAATAIRYRCTDVAIEPNFGGGMFGQLMQPLLVKAAETIKQPDGKPSIVPKIDDDFRWSRGQKEVRILDTLEPLIQAHKLIVDRAVIEKDEKQLEDGEGFSLFYQMTRLTRDKGSLGHDDRIEALSMACEFWVERMNRDQEKMVTRAREVMVNSEIVKIKKIMEAGGLLVTDNRIGGDSDRKRSNMTRRSGNTHFNLRKVRR